MGGNTCRKTPIPRSALDKNPMPGHLFKDNPVEEGTTRRGTDTLVHRPEKPADSKHIVHGVADGRTRLSNFIFTFHFHLFIFGSAGSLLLCGLFSSKGYSLLAVHRLLIAVASLAAEHRTQSTQAPQLQLLGSGAQAQQLWALNHRLSGCGTWVSLLCSL